MKSLKEFFMFRNKSMTEYETRRRELKKKINLLKVDLENEVDPNNIDEYLKKKGVLEITERQMSNIKEPQSLDLDKARMLIREEETNISKKYSKIHEEKYQKLLKAAIELAQVKEDSKEEIRNFKGDLNSFGVPNELIWEVSDPILSTEGIKVEFGGLDKGWVELLKNGQRSILGVVKND